MKQLFHHYERWEDWQAGSYALRSADPRGQRAAAVALLGDAGAFSDAARAMLPEWAYAAEVNLTNGAVNQRAWLGQAACCYDHDAPEFIVREAWSMLTPEQRHAANRVADQIIAEWRADRAETLFGS